MTCAALSANFKVLIDSWEQFEHGDMVAMRNVLQFPLIESYRSLVSFESLNGGKNYSYFLFFDFLAI